MLLTSLNELFKRDLNRLKKQVELYQKEEDIWIIADGITNSAGNLCLHLIGNLNHFIGHVLGGSDYKRDREFEFAGKNVSRDQLLKDIDTVILTIANVLENLSENDLQKNFPIDVFGEPISTMKFLIHLQGHLNYHLGQINYHRRILGSENLS